MKEGEGTKEFSFKKAFLSLVICVLIGLVIVNIKTILSTIAMLIGSVLFLFIVFVLLLLLGYIFFRAALFFVSIFFFLLSIPILFVILGYLYDMTL